VQDETSCGSLVADPDRGMTAAMCPDKRTPRTAADRFARETIGGVRSTDTDPTGEVHFAVAFGKLPPDMLYNC
jgi:hypothetical protein